MTSKRPSFTDEEALALIIGLGLVLIIFCVVQLFYLLTLSKTIAAVRPEFRKVTPGQAWLGFIPIFHLIWPFIINPKVIASIREDLEDRGYSENGDFGKTLGSVYPGLRIAGNIPTIGGLFGLGYLVVFIIWWVKLGGYKSKLETLKTSKREDLLDN